MTLVTHRTSQDSCFLQVERIWKRSWHFPTYLFFLNRYATPLVRTIIVVGKRTAYAYGKRVEIVELTCGAMVLQHSMIPYGELK